jgi:hypothetical protein
MYPERHLLNLEKYKEELWTGGVRDMLKFFGLSESGLTLRNELVDSSNGLGLDRLPIPHLSRRACQPALIIIELRIQLDSRCC